jgi:plastocyanin
MPKLSRLTRVVVLALGVGIVAFGVAACGDDDDDGSGSETQTLSVSVDAAGKITGLKSVEAGVVELDFKNNAKVPYDLQLVKVDGNQTGADVLKVTNEGEEGSAIPGWLHGTGGVGTIPPGQSASATQVLEPGRYHALAEPDTEGEGGPKPTTAALEVTGEAGDAKLPATDARIEAIEYSFKTSGLKSGSNEITFANTGKELHHVIGAPIQPGKTLADARKFFSSDEEPSGPPPVDFEKGFSTVVLDGGTEQVTTLNLQKGKYAFVCFLPDRAGGPPHIAKGMITEVDVS